MKYPPGAPGQYPGSPGTIIHYSPNPWQPCTPHRLIRMLSLPGPYCGQGASFSDVGSLFDATEHLLQPGRVKPDHELTACRNHGHTPRLCEFDHFIQRSPVFGHIDFREFETFLRKKLFRRLAVRSRRCGIDLDLFISHGCFSFPSLI